VSFDGDVSGLPTWAFVVVIVGALYLILNVLSRTSGWTELADHYGGASRLVGARRRFQSLSMGRGGLMMMNINNAAILTVTPSALEIAVFFPFNLTMKPLVIPFSDVTATISKQMFMFTSVDLKTVRAEEIIIRLSEGQARWIEQEAGAKLAYVDAA